MYRENENHELLKTTDQNIQTGCNVTPELNNLDI